MLKNHDIFEFSSLTIYSLTGMSHHSFSLSLLEYYSWIYVLILWPQNAIIIDVQVTTRWTREAKKKKRLHYFHVYSGTIRYYILLLEGSKVYLDKR